MSEYLTVLSKVMRENQTGNGLDKTSYDRLYGIAYSELNTQLKESRYPEAPALMQRLGRMLDDMESLFICNEMVGKACLLLSNYRTNELFSLFDVFFLSRQFAKRLSWSSVQIPFIVIHDDANYIELLNYADQRIPLSQDEYRLLISESKKNQVALNKIVQAFIVHTPLKRENVCLVFDNIYGDAEQRFERAVCKYVACVDRIRAEKIQRSTPSHLDAILCDAELETSLASLQVRYGCHFIRKNNLTDYLDQQVCPVLYGFRDEFQAIKVQIDSFYFEALRQTKDISSSINADMTRQSASVERTRSALFPSLQASVESLENNHIARRDTSEDQTLSDLLQSSRSKAEFLERNHKKLLGILGRMEACVEQIEDVLNDTVAVGKLVPRRVYDDVFSALFDSEKNCAKLSKTLHSRLIALGYDECELVAQYVQAVSGQKPKVAYHPIASNQWEKAKMYLEIAELESLPETLLRDYVRAISPFWLATGKEYYAEALLATEQSKTRILQESFDRGYEPAGKALWIRYEKGDSQVNLQTLANALVPEACMEMARQKKDSRPAPQFYANLSSVEFTYYKIAAGKEYLPAIEEIVDTVYQSRFSEAYQPYGDDLKKPGIQQMIKHGKILYRLCKYLLEKGYRPEHFSEICGVVLYCLNENLSKAKGLLNGINTGVANYCKGKMYEFGIGEGHVGQDFEQAIRHYKMALDQGFPKPTQEQLEKCQSKWDRQKASRNSSRTYHEEVNYHATESNHSYQSSGGCVITTAACAALGAPDDCEELQLLRWFRDTHLNGTDKGEAIVREYYRVGPLIIEQIGKTPKPAALYRCLWDQYIEPSCAAIRAQQWDHAKSIYIKMVKGLCADFEIELLPHISKILEYY